MNPEGIVDAIVTADPFIEAETEYTAEAVYAEVITGNGLCVNGRIEDDKPMPTWKVGRPQRARKRPRDLAEDGEFALDEVALPNKKPRRSAIHNADSNDRKGKGAAVEASQLLRECRPLPIYGEDGNVCRYCGIIYASVERRRSHEKMVTQDGTQTCSECSFTALSTCLLSRHFVLKHPHKRQGTFQCDQCSAKFLADGSLHAHNKAVHNKERPFKCLQCEMTFKRNTHLKRHIQSTHDIVKKFACPFCKYDSGRKEHFKKHVQRRHFKDGISVEQLDEICVRAINLAAGQSAVVKAARAMEPQINDEIILAAGATASGDNVAD